MKQFYTVKDVMRILQVKEAKAYKIRFLAEFSG